MLMRVPHLRQIAPVDDDFLLKPGACVSYFLNNFDYKDMLPSFLFATQPWQCLRRLLPFSVHHTLRAAHIAARPKFHAVCLKKLTLLRTGC